VKKLSKPLEYSFRLLAQRAYTEKKLTEKLESREVETDEIKAIIGKLKGLGYIDDAKFAKDFVENAQGIRLTGKRKIYWQLIKRVYQKKLLRLLLAVSI